MGDRPAERKACCNLGNAYRRIGDFKMAKNYHECNLKICQEMADKLGEGSACGNLGNVYYCRGDFKTAITYHERHLKIAKELGDRTGEGKAYCNLGNTHNGLRNFKTAIDFLESGLKVNEEIGNKKGEGGICCNLGNAHEHQGNFKTAIDYHLRALAIAREVGDLAGEGMAYGNLGNDHRSLGDFKMAIDYYKRHLEIALEMGNRAEEGKTYSNLGNAHFSLGDVKTAKVYYECGLKIAVEVGDRAQEGHVCGSLGNAYDKLGDLATAIDYHTRCLTIAKEVGDKSSEGSVYGKLGVYHWALGDFKTALRYQEHCLQILKGVGDTAGVAETSFNLGLVFESLGSASKALDHYRSSVTTFDEIRNNLQFNDELKISWRDMHQKVYTRLWTLLLKQGEVLEALFSAEQGRAQALKDLMELKYASEAAPAESETINVNVHDLLSCLPSNTVFIAIEENELIFWIHQKGKEVELRRKQISNDSSRDGGSKFLQSLIKIACQEIGARAGVKCEDRSLDTARVGDQRSPPNGEKSEPSNLRKSALRTWYDTIVDPIIDLLYDSEVIIVPEGPLWLAPYAAFLDANSKYLCESFRIRQIPSLTSLRLIADCSTGYHFHTGALLVGDPWLEEVTFQGQKLQQLPCARKEVEMIGQILHSTPLVGKQATKDEVLKRLSSVALVHVAAHGRMETGEIALAPNPTSASRASVEKDFVLTMRDVLSVQLRARLVVLSCCHSGRGDIKAEGVVGIARAFLGAGARSVLVSLWAIDDEATLEFMKHFYQHLLDGRKASDALSQAMRCMRESDQFSEVKYWAPFVLIGDDVTLEFGAHE